MKDEHPASGEVVIKEYPNSTRWLEGQRVIGDGNLILTNERLAFLHRVALTDEEFEYVQKLSQEATTSKMVDFALSIHKKNFQFPLTSVIEAKTGMFSILPFPRPCLRISYISPKKKKTKTVTFMFTIPLLKGFFQTEFATVKAWVNAINRAVRHKQFTT